MHIGRVAIPNRIVPRSAAVPARSKLASSGFRLGRHVPRTSRWWLTATLLVVFGAGCAATRQLIWYNPNVDNQTAQIHLMQ